MNNDKGEKISSSKSGYQFSEDGSIEAVCGYSKESKELEVEDIEENSN
jgi:hypothetical protein